VGRAWPLLAGERAHLTLQQGGDVLPAMRAMAAMAGPGGMIPEQVWDAPAIPERGLEPGHPSGSAMPLVWAHAEYLKLAYARSRGRPLELLDVVQRRYGARRPEAGCWLWREAAPIDALPSGRALRIEAPAPFSLHLGWDDWRAVEDVQAKALPFGLYGVELSAERLEGHERLRFTLQRGDGSWSADAEVRLGDPPPR
jgi:glucoamylase